MLDYLDMDMFGLDIPVDSTIDISRIVVKAEYQNGAKKKLPFASLTWSLLSAPSGGTLVGSQFTAPSTPYSFCILHCEYSEHGVDARMDFTASTVPK